MVCELSKVTLLRHDHTITQSSMLSLVYIITSFSPDHIYLHNC